MAVLDIDAADLTIMTGFELPDPLPGLSAGTISVADLIWDARRLTADQIRQLREMVKALNPHHDNAHA